MAQKRPLPSMLVRLVFSCREYDFDTAKKGQKYGTAKYLGKKFAIKAKKDEKTEKSSNFATLLRPYGLNDKG
jgi:hypothetical protein